MIEFPVDVLGAIESMFLRSLGNPNAIVYTTKTIIYSYYHLIILILLCVVIIFLIKVLYEILKGIKEKKKDRNNFIKYLYEFFKNIKKNWKISKKLLVKNDIKEILFKEKEIFKVLEYPIIGCILVGINRIPVSFIFWLLSKHYGNLDMIREILPTQEGWVLGVRSFYSLLFFTIAGCFIGLSFGNKMLRNIGILIYALGILFILFAYFLDSGVIINNLPNFTV